MEKVVSYNEYRHIWEEAKALNDTVKEEKRNFTAEEQEKWNRLNALLDAFEDEQQRKNEEKEREARLKERESRLNAPAQDAVSTERPETYGNKSVEQRFVDTEEYRQAWLHYVRTGQESRALSEGTDSAGGYTVPTITSSNLNELLVQESFILSLASIDDVSSNTVNYPVVASNTAMAIHTEGSTTWGSDPTFGSKAITVYMIGHEMPVSIDLLQDSAVDLEGFIARNFRVLLADKIDALGIAGTGSSQPYGLLAESAQGKQAAANNTITWAELLDLQESVAEPYFSRGSWIFHQSTRSHIRSLTQSGQGYVWTPSGIDGAPSQLMGRPVYTNSNMPELTDGVSSKVALYGDISQFQVARHVSGLQFQRDDSVYFNKAQVSFRIYMRLGMRQLNVNAVKHLALAAV